MPLSVFELRNYQMQPTMRDHFIDYFNEFFIFSQQDVNMHVLGQFRVIGAPDHYVWIRGFEDMATRQAGLQSFYGGSVWQKHRDRANSMMVDSDHVHLLRSINHPQDLTQGRTVYTVAAELANATLALNTGVLAIDFYRTNSLSVEDAATQLEKAYNETGVPLRAVLTTELSENTFPRLPVIQNVGEIVLISAYENEEMFHQQVAPPVETGLFTPSHASLLLSPTLRSPMRW